MMARRSVEKEDGKWRSGREGERLGWAGPLDWEARWKAVAGPLGHDEGVAAQHDGNVMMPALKASAFEVVEPQLPFHFLVRFLGSVALLEQTDDPLLRHLAVHTQRRQGEVRGRLLAVAPLDDQPLRLAVRPIG